MTKLVRYKTFFHLPKQEMNYSNKIKGGSIGNKKLKLRPNALSFFKFASYHNKEVLESKRLAELTQQKTIEALAGLSSMASLKGASAYPSTTRTCNKKSIAVRNLSRMLH